MPSQACVSTCSRLQMQQQQHTARASEQRAAGRLLWGLTEREPLAELSACGVRAVAGGGVRARGGAGRQSSGKRGGGRHAVAATRARAPRRRQRKPGDCLPRGMGKDLDQPYRAPACYGGRQARRAHPERSPLLPGAGACGPAAPCRAQPLSPSPPPLWRRRPQRDLALPHPPAQRPSPPSLFRSSVAASQSSASAAPGAVGTGVAAAARGEETLRAAHPRRHCAWSACAPSCARPGDQPPSHGCRHITVASARSATTASAAPAAAAASSAASLPLHCPAACILPCWLTEWQPRSLPLYTAPGTWARCNKAALPRCAKPFDQLCVSPHLQWLPNGSPPNDVGAYRRSHSLPVHDAPHNTCISRFRNITEENSSSRCCM